MENSVLSPMRGQSLIPFIEPMKYHSYQKSIHNENWDSDHTCQGFTARSISRLGLKLALNVMWATRHHEQFLVLLVQVFDLIRKDRLLIHGLVVFKWRCYVSGMRNFSTITHNSLTSFFRLRDTARKMERKLKKTLRNHWKSAGNLRQLCNVST